MIGNFILLENILHIIYKSLILATGVKRLKSLNLEHVAGNGVKVPLTTLKHGQSTPNLPHDNIKQSKLQFLRPLSNQNHLKKYQIKAHSVLFNHSTYQYLKSYTSTFRFHKHLNPNLNGTP